jgi:hypothetical protein
MVDSGTNKKKAHKNNVNTYCQEICTSSNIILLGKLGKYYFCHYTLSARIEVNMIKNKLISSKIYTSIRL